jgi:hypothetical protein
LLSCFRTAKRVRASAARIFLAVLLLLVLLSSVVPFSSLASHRCQMACCLGKPPHAEGSCSVAFPSDENREAAEDRGEEHSAHHQAQHSSAHRSSSKESAQTASVASQVLTTPCSPECACAAAASTRSPRPREMADVSAATPARPPTAAPFRKDYARTLLPSAARRRQIRPRAPPISPVNLSA